MKRKQESGFCPVGTVSLMTVFITLCLVVFAMLSLQTALADRRLAEASVKNVEQYYAADLEAQEVFARLRAGEQCSGVREQDGKYVYECPIAGNGYLAVELECREDGWQVLRWQAVAGEPAPEEEPLNLWTGNMQQEEKP